jgi:hypothetical protein
MVAIKREAEEGTVKYANHNLEFMNFYDKHRKLCDILCGLRYDYKFNTLNPELNDKILISKYNLGIGINLVGGFKSRYGSNIRSQALLNSLNFKINQIIEDFENDNIYQDYIKKGQYLSKEDDLNLTLKYLDYLKRLFEFLYEFELELQKTLAVGPKEIYKALLYTKNDEFFKYSFEYATDTANFFNNMYYDELLDSYKKIMSYYYTYKYILFTETKEILDLNLSKLRDVVLDQDTLDKIKKIKNIGKENINSEFKKELRVELMQFKNLVFDKIYFRINYDLQRRNILPKMTNRVMIDKSLI